MVFEKHWGKVAFTYISLLTST